MSSPDRLFEVSWEVCNKVGGINTVIKSKAYLMKEHYKEYYLIGPYFKDKAEIELRKKEPPQEFKEAFKQLAQEGIICHYGVWDVFSQPTTILIETNDAFISKKNSFKTKYWEQFGVDSLGAGWEFEEPLMFSTAAGRIIEELSKKQEQKTIAHLHEWLSGFAILYLQLVNSSIATVFTTHATMLGRTIAGNNEDLYQVLESLNPEQKAQELRVHDKHSAERASAKCADIFTTVSDITALEAEKILGRKPEVILYNGLTLSKFPTVEETSIKHVQSRDKLHEFIAYYFYPYYTFDMYHTIIFFVSGRFEYHNKGLDLFLESLQKLNQELKEQGSNKTVVVIYWTPLATAGVRKSLIENKNAYLQIKNYMDWHAQTILKQLTWDFLVFGAQNNEQQPEYANGLCGIFTQDFLQELKNDLKHFKREGQPPLSTHALLDAQYNPLYQRLQELGLNNNPEDKVKSIIYPSYLDGADGILNMHYYEATVGANLGVFPSFYEPWGYTPLESAALAVPAITTDLAGFGLFVNEQRDGQEEKGVFVIKRRKQSWGEQQENLYKVLKDFCSLDHVGRVEHRLAAKTIAAKADWKIFAKNYFEAHNKAHANKSK